MDFLFDMGLIEIVITAVTFLLVAGVSWIGAYFKLPATFQKKLTQFIEVAATELEKAVDEESEKGRKITRNEIKNGLYATFRKVFKKNPEELTSAKTE
jgi:lipoate-protein ligase A